LFAVLCLVLGGLAVAQDQDDPPSRVARVQFLEGQVSMQPGGVSDWIDAPMNRPLTTADRMWTDQNSRAELSLATTSMMLGPETSMTLLNLNDQTSQIELDQGTLILSVRYLAPGEVVEVDTPNFAFTAFRSGIYRFHVEPDNDRSSVMVRREGDGEATGNGEPVHMHDGYFAIFTNGQSLNYEVRDLPGRDWLDDWAASSERQAQQSVSARYVPAGTVGYESLDGNGQWVVSPIYGSVWYPNVAPGWAPYRYGHWAWIEPWGWTWVDDAPWGFAPFHYGRWVNDSGRWAWIPGPAGVRPVYSPAMVAWVGGVGVGVGVAWVPLGWHDPFIPAYHVSPVYARNVNISNSKVVNVTVINNYYSTTNVTVRNTTINNIRYENTTVNGAVTGAPANAMASGRPMSQVGTAVSANAAAHASVMATASVAPTHESVLGGHASAAAPAGMAAPRVIAAKTPPPPPPVKFEQQREMLQKNNGMPLSPQVRTSLQASSPAPAQHVVVSGQPNRPNAYRPPASNVPANTQVQPNRPGQPNPQTQPYSQPPRANQPATQTSVPHPPQLQAQPTAPAQPQVQQPRNAQPAQPGAQPNQPNQQKKPAPKPPKEEEKEKEKEREHGHSR
jgi:hypothetical protein